LDIGINHSAKVLRLPRMLQNLLGVKSHLSFLKITQGRC
jgi:hypothetical protein